MRKRRLSAKWKSAAKGFKEGLFSLGIKAAERGWLPLPLLRAAVATALTERLAREDHTYHKEQGLGLFAQVHAMRAAALDEQLEAPGRLAPMQRCDFYRLLLGSRICSIGALWTGSAKKMADAELALLQLIGKRAEISDGQRILVIDNAGGALAFWLAQEYPAAQITLLIAGPDWQQYLAARAQRYELPNLAIEAGVLSQMVVGRFFDRILVSGLFEQAGDYGGYFKRVADLLQPGGRFFATGFCHRRYLYKLEGSGAAQWLMEHFLPGRLVLPQDFLLHFQGDLVMLRQWRVSGRHYQKSFEVWRRRLERQRKAALQILGQGGNRRAARRSYQRWRLFLLIGAECFGYRHGEEWGYTQCLFQKAGDA